MTLDIPGYFGLAADPFAPSDGDAPSGPALLTQKQGAAFIEERVARAGGQAELFSRAAQTALWQASGGVPHRLRWLAGLAMIEAMLSGARNIDVSHVHAAANQTAVGRAPAPPPPMPDRAPPRSRRRFALPVPTTGQAAAILAAPVVVLSAAIVSDMISPAHVTPARLAVERPAAPTAEQPMPGRRAPADVDIAAADALPAADAVESNDEVAGPYIIVAPPKPADSRRNPSMADADATRAEQPAPLPQTSAVRPEPAPEAGAAPPRPLPRTEPEPERASRRIAAAAPPAPATQSRASTDVALLERGAPAEPEGALAARLAEEDPAAPVQVFIHHAPENRTAAAALAASLVARGWPIAELRPVDVRVRQPNNRYFFREDADPAFALAEDLSDLTGVRARARAMRSYERPPRAGTLEVWLPSRG